MIDKEKLIQNGEGYHTPRQVTKGFRQLAFDENFKLMPVVWARFNGPVSQRCTMQDPGKYVFRYEWDGGSERKLVCIDGHWFTLVEKEANELWKKAVGSCGWESDFLNRMTTPGMIPRHVVPEWEYACFRNKMNKLRRFVSYFGLDKCFLEDPERLRKYVRTPKDVQELNKEKVWGPEVIKGLWEVGGTTLVFQCNKNRPAKLVGELATLDGAPIAETDAVVTVTESESQIKFGVYYWKQELGAKKTKTKRDHGNTDNDTTKLKPRNENQGALSARPKAQETFPETAAQRRLREQYAARNQARRSDGQGES